MRSECVDETSNEHCTVDVDRLVMLVVTKHEIYNVANTMN